MADDITGRDDYVIAQALYVAIKTLHQAEFPQLSNIEDMQAILDGRYPGAWDEFELQHYARLALARGWKAAGQFTVNDLKKWLAENPDDPNKVLPFRPRH